METLTVICGIPEGLDNDTLLEKVVSLIENQNITINIYRCKSKIEIEHAVYDAQQNAVVLLQEMFEKTSPYTSWELAVIRDIQNIPVIVSVARKHYGTEYLAILYGAGIVDAVFEDEAGAACIAERLIRRRNRKNCRGYYGIQLLSEVIATISIIPEDILIRYLSYIESALNHEEMLERYINIRKKLSYIENCYLAERMSSASAEELKEDTIFKSYCTPLGKKRKSSKRLFNRRK